MLCIQPLMGMDKRGVKPFEWKPVGKSDGKSFYPERPGSLQVPSEGKGRDAPRSVFSINVTHILDSHKYPTSITDVFMNKNNDVILYSKETEGSFKKTIEKKSSNSHFTSKETLNFFFRNVIEPILQEETRYVAQKKKKMIESNVYSKTKESITKLSKKKKAS